MMGSAAGVHSTCAHAGGNAHSQCRGVGLVEFLVALVIFAISVNALSLAQLNGKRMHDVALQHTRAVTLAADLFERIAANGQAISAYQMGHGENEAQWLELPENDCSVATCNAIELARYDMWQWQAAVRGHHQQRGETLVAALAIERVCVRSTASVVTVTFVWPNNAGSTGEDAPDCAVHSDDELGADEATQEPSAAAYRRFSLSTYLGGPG